MRNFGRLAEEMKRAVSDWWSIPVCTTNSGRSSRASKYMTANTPMAPADIERQIKRYYVLPGQALSYKVGMLSILELREACHGATRREAFDIREFHDTVLKKRRSSNADSQ